MNATKSVKVYRGDYVESTHDVHIAIVNAKGDLLKYYGNPFRQTFARSSMKPIQALPVVESGAIEEFGITDRELALFCASHSGEPIHRESVFNVLKKINLEESHLQCGPHEPYDKDSYHELIKNGQSPTPVYSNCSGKHVGMLSACVKLNMDVSGYRDVKHPYQQHIIDHIADVADYDRGKIKTAVDGCGVPVHRLPLYNIALAFARLASPDQWDTDQEERKLALRKIADAMTSYPEMVAGTKRFDTDLMKAFQGRIVAKGGAEGVHCFGDRETGIGVALKVEDGNARATSVASMEVIKQLGIGTPAIWEQLENYHRAPVLNTREETVGEIVPYFNLYNI